MDRMRTSLAGGIIAGMLATGSIWTCGVPYISQAAETYTITATDNTASNSAYCPNLFDAPINDIMMDEVPKAENKLAAFSERRFEVGSDFRSEEQIPEIEEPLLQGNEDTEEDAVHSDEHVNLDIELPPADLPPAPGTPPASTPSNGNSSANPNMPKPDTNWTESDFTKMTQRDFSGKSISEKIELIGSMAKADMEQSGILASVTAAQAILESGWMESGLARHNALFGIKATANIAAWEGSTWTGTSVNLKTGEEYTPGQLTMITAGFRTYPSIWASVKDHSSYLTNAMKGNQKRYPNIVGCKDPRKCFQIIKDGGYATDSQYVDKLMRVVDCYDLTRFDR